MSAQEQMRAMLDQLMGTQRDGLEDDGQDQIHFTDSVVCKSFLLGIPGLVWKILASPALPMLIRLGLLLSSRHSERDSNGLG